MAGGKRMKPRRRRCTQKTERAASGGDAAETAITNVFSGGPARGFVTRVMRELGPMSVAAPEFQLQVLPWSTKESCRNKGDTAFTSLWSGQSTCF
ncbi:hypothetical protein GQ600_24878 [Phytophthora cactorum]|nr:hypothetical protein GQ600_24878 [Phytophthora cactorum]